MTAFIDRFIPPLTPSPGRNDDWLATDPAALDPIVVFAGGFLTWPKLYHELAATLRERGAADVVQVPTYPQDWLLAPVTGLGRIVTRTGRSLLEGCARSAASPRAKGAPVLFIGHSAGGISGRILTSPVPFEGRSTGAAGRIGALVTLGTPHLVGDEARWGRQVGQAGARFANRHVPGAFHAPTTGYLAVGSRFVVGDPTASDGRSRTAYRIYCDVDSSLAGTPLIEGDGLIPLGSALLPGVRHLVLDEAVHGPWAAGARGTGASRRSGPGGRSRSRCGVRRLRRGRRWRPRGEDPFSGSPAESVGALTAGATARRERGRPVRGTTVRRGSDRGARRNVQKSAPWPRQGRLIRWIPACSDPPRRRRAGITHGRAGSRGPRAAERRCHEVPARSR